MNNADEYATSKHIDTKPLIAVSRDAVQTAEDAREIAVKKLDEIRLAMNASIERCTGAIAGASRQCAATEGPSSV